jgi:hypothetical protein
VGNGDGDGAVDAPFARHGRRLVQQQSQREGPTRRNTKHNVQRREDQ